MEYSQAGIDTFKKNNIFGQLRKIINYFPYYRKKNQTNFVKKNLRPLQEDGFVVIENFISNEDLTYIKNKLKNAFEIEKTFELPLIAQSRLNPDKDSDLIDNFLRGSIEIYKSRNLTFEFEDIKSYQQMLIDFQPATLKQYILDDEIFYKYWLNNDVLDLVEAYMGLKPKLIEAYVRRNFYAKFKSTNHFWHRDTNNKDYLLKAFFLFTDCTLETGPHEYVKGSVEDLTLNCKTYFSDNEVEQLYPEASGKRVKSVLPAGTLIIEDTRGIHRACVPNKGFRDMGYAVFFPTKWFGKIEKRHYKISKKFFNKLNIRQQEYIPKSYID